MQRKIKFRGKSLADLYDFQDDYVFKKGEWVYGSLIVSGDDCYIVGEVIDVDDRYIALGKTSDGDKTIQTVLVTSEWWVKVDPETVGQCIGLKDIENGEIYELDVLYSFGSYKWLVQNGSYNRLVQIRDGHPVLVWKDKDNGSTHSDPLTKEDIEQNGLRIVGNAMDNPELLEAER